jgi:muramoyltetrapeptide carboxypeptidase
VKSITPPHLKPNDTIGLITPSSPMQEGRLELGVRYLEQQGFKTRVGRYVHLNDFLT